MKNKLNIKIAFFDIDGTLVNSNKEITKDTINTLNKLSNNNIKIVLCSGRSNSYLMNFLKDINIDYLISSNGARIYDIKNNKNIYTNLMNINNIKFIWEYCNNNELSCMLVTDNISYSNKYTNIETINNKNVLTKELTDINNINNNIYQIIVESICTKKMYNLELLLKEKKELKLINYTYDYINKDYCFFDIVNKEINKGTGIKFLLENININKKNSICFGDSVNDFDMFNNCGIKVAMGNAIDELKKIADHITDTNDNNGICIFFDNYLE